MTGPQNATLSSRANAVDNGKIANGAVSDARSVSVSGSKVTGDIAGNAALNHAAKSITGGQVSSAVKLPPPTPSAMRLMPHTQPAPIMPDTVTSGVHGNSSYADPSFVTSLAGAKITGSVANDFGSQRDALHQRHLPAADANNTAVRSSSMRPAILSRSPTVRSGPRSTPAPSAAILA